jgi:antitoxin PrlF
LHEPGERPLSLQEISKVIETAWAGRQLQQRYPQVLTLTVTAKGQVTLRKDVLRHLGVSPGERLAVELLPNGEARIRQAKSGGSIEDFIGFLEDPDGVKLTIDQIKEITEDGWARRR